MFWSGFSDGEIFLKFLGFQQGQANSAYRGLKDADLKIQGYLGVWMIQKNWFYWISKINVKIHQFTYLKQTFEAFIMGANDDFDNKQLISTGFCIQIIKGQKFP